jgi:hypothetical protein
MKLDDLWDEGESFSIGGRSARALSLPNRLLHSCYHAALGDWPLRLGSLRDVAEQMRRLDGAYAVIRERAAEWDVEAVVAAAVADAHRLLGLTEEDELARWAGRYVASRRHEAWLGLHTRHEKTFAAQALLTLTVLARWRDRAAYLRALAMPDRQYTAGRHASAFGRFRYAIREARRGLRARR